MLKFSKIILVFALLSAFAGCNKKEVKEKEFTEDSYYINASELNEKVEKNEDLIIIDARAKDAYDKGHIDGAINVIWQQLSNVSVESNQEGFGVVLPPKELEKVLQNLGINENSEIVLYSNGAEGWGEDGRILWTLLLNGVDNMKLLDGGYNAWTSKEFTTSKETTVLDKGNISLIELNNDFVINTKELKKSISDGTIKLIDTRDESEYEGAVKYGESKGGKIPSAINIPFINLYNKDNTIKSQEEVDKIMQDAGISKDDEIVTYCTAGIRSASMFVTLKSYGYENVKNYDESFYRWAAIEEVE
ncbi:MAG: rhodanese-like domain-containing protein [Bacilli bacterium]